MLLRGYLTISGLKSLPNSKLASFLGIKPYLLCYLTWFTEHSSFPIMTSEHRSVIRWM